MYSVRPNRRREEREGLAKMYASERLEEYAAVNDERLQERLLHVPDDVWAAAELDPGPAPFRPARMSTSGEARTIAAWRQLKILRALTARRAGRAFAVPVGAGFAVVNAMANYMGGSTQELEPVRRDAVWQIGKYLSGVDLYYMHFSNLNKLGVRPCAEVDEEGRCAKIAGFNTPLGIYGYPIAPGFFEREGPRGRIIGGVAWGDVQRPPRTRIRVPFAGERNYVHVFRARQPEHLLWINFMSDDDLAASGFSAYTTLVGAAERRARLLARVPSPGGFFWYLLREIAEEFEEEEPSVAWARLLRSLGIDGVVDMASEDMTAIIHHNEPMQAVLFTKQDVEQVESMQLRWIQKSVRKTKASAEHAEYAEGAAKQALFDFRHGHLSALQTVHTVHDLFPGDPVLSVEELEEVKAILDHVDQNPETPHGTWQAVMDTWDNVVNGATTLAEAKQRMLAALAKHAEDAGEFVLHLWQLKQALWDFRYGYTSALQTVHTVHDLFPGDPVLSVEELEEVKAILDHVDQTETPHGTLQAVVDIWDNVVKGATTLAEAKQRMLAALADAEGAEGAAKHAL